MEKTLASKTIIVTGAASGIGEAAANLFADAGASLVLGDIDVDRGEALADAIRRRGGEAQFCRVDVANEGEVRSMVAEACDRFGRLDGAFNNAGIGYVGKPLHELDLSDWQRTLDINLTGIFLCMKHEIAAMLQTGGGAIVNTGSIASTIGLPTCPEYNASKHGMVGLMRSAAIDYSARGIRVNTLLVGGTMTPLLVKQQPNVASDRSLAERLSLLHRLADPREIAESALWLLSERSSFIAGAAVPVDVDYTVA